MRWRFLVWRMHEDCRYEDDGYWRSLCVVFDSESLGILERTFSMLGWKFKVEKE